MNIDALKYIPAIAKEGNLSAAAKKLDVSTPALSKYLRNTEDIIGMPLFSSSKRKYIPTEAGQAFIKAAEEIIKIRKDTISAIASLENDVPDAFRVGLSPNRGVTILSNIFSDFERQCPQTELIAFEGAGMTIQRQIQQGELDGALGITHDEMPNILKDLPLYEEELVLAVPAIDGDTYTGEGLASLPSADIKDFKDRVFVMPDANSFMRKLILKIFEEEGIDPAIVTVTPNTTLLESMVRKGNRVSVLPSYYVKKDPEITFYRLNKSIKIYISYIYNHDTPFSMPERYFIYLATEYGRKMGSPVTWSDELRAIMEEFSEETVNGH